MGHKYRAGKWLAGAIVGLHLLATPLLIKAETTTLPATQPTTLPATMPTTLPTTAPTTKSATKPATTKPAPAVKVPTEGERAAVAAYDELVTAYLQNDFSTLEKNLKTISNVSVRLNQEQRLNIEYIRKAAIEQRPKWWANTKSSSNTSFQSGIWGRQVMTNFVPADDLGVQVPVAVKDGKLVTVVAWRPTNVDNPRPADGRLAKDMNLTKGDIGEIVVWHELGHLFITAQLSVQDAYELYTKYEVLYDHLQEFFADMTAIHHSTPHARRVAMILRLDSLDPPMGKYRELEPHTRGAHAIGSMFLMEVLKDPAKWPNVHLPPVVPTGEVELKTIVYLYEHFTNQWTLAEDKAMRDWALKVVRTQGDQIFRSKGMIPLPDKNTFSLMEAQDREHQKKRDTWVAENLKKAIDKGQADKAAPNATTQNLLRHRFDRRIEVPIY